jgi:PAS domain S-box-containing protein
VKELGRRLSSSTSERWSPHLTVVLAAAIVVLAAMTGLTARGLSQLHKDTEWLVHTERVRFEIGRLLQLVTDVETSVRGFEVNGDEQFLGPYRAALPQIPTELATLEQLIADNPLQRAAVARLRALSATRVTQAQRIVSLAAAGDFGAAQAFTAGGEGRRTMDEIRGVVAQMLTEEGRLLDLRRQSSNLALAAVARAQWVVGGLAVTLLLLIVYISVRHNSRLRRADQTLGTILRSVGDAVIATDALGQVRFMNAVAESLTGWGHQEAYGQPLDMVFRIINEHTRETVESPAAKVLREGRIVGLANHTLLIARDGHEFPIADSGAPIRDGNELAGVVVVFRDATAERAAQDALKDRERQFVSLANAMPQLVWAESPIGDHEYFNRGWYAYTGLTEEESRAADVWMRVLHGDDQARVSARWARARDSGELYEAEFRLRRHDGAYRWFLGRAIADRDPDGTILRWLGTSTDIHHTKQTEDTLRRAEAALRDADRRKDVFLATLAHELRNPLAPIRNAARLLEKPALNPLELERSRAIILRQVRHMASLLDDLLDISRITRGAFALKKEYVRLQPLLTEALETARPLIDAKRHTLTTDWPSQPIEIAADPVRLVQVVSNLLTNAAKYTDPEGSIICSARADGDTVVISVRDTGIGLAPHMLSEVFEMFSQAQPNQGHSDGGLGIGLALVKGLVELHGGRVEVRSSGLGQGSEFTIYLPNLRVATGTIQDLSKTIQPPSDLSERRILVADDNRDGAESLAMLLEGLGCKVYLAHTGVDALALAAQHRPHAAILDIGMPGRSGFEVAQQIRREAWGSNIILIALTGWGQEEYKRAAQSAGFDHHLTKPVDLEALEVLILPKNDQLA